MKSAMGKCAVVVFFKACYTNRAVLVGEEEDVSLKAEAEVVARHFIEHKAAPKYYAAPPLGTSAGLFVPRRHQCNTEKLANFLKEYPDQKKTTEKQKTIEKSLVLMHDVLEKNGFPTILEGGSTLGFYRNCGVIPGDADGDVAIMGSWFHSEGNSLIEGNLSAGVDAQVWREAPKFKALEASFKEVGGSLGSSMCPYGPTYKGCEMRVSFDDHSYVDLMVYAHEKACEKAPCSFISPIWPGGEVGKTFAPCTTGDIHFEQALFLDRTFWVQAPMLSYMKEEYGDTWKDPNGWASAGVYKNCNFHQQEEPTQDPNMKTMPSAEYVLKLQKHEDSATFSS